MKNSLSYLFAALTLIVGCGNADTTSAGGATTTTTSTTAGSGGTGGVTETATGGTTSSTETTSNTTTPTCDIPGAVPCGPEIPGEYPDTALAYDPAMPIVSAVIPIPGTPEVGNAAGTGRVGPWDHDVSIVALTFVLAALPDALCVAVPVEADNCGLPSVDPNTIAIDIDPASLTSEPFAGDILVTVPLPSPIPVATGASAYPSRIMVAGSDYVYAILPNAAADGKPSRSMWWGIVDDDCDGTVDASLGWAYLLTPTAPGVIAYPHDFAIGVIVE